MAQHLCIVARDKPLLLGYLNIVLEHLSANGDELQIVIDRRPDAFQIEDPVSPRSALVPDQRHVRGVDELLRTQGYAIVSREDGMSWQLSDRGEEPVEELSPVDELAEAETEATHDASRRRTLLSALAVVAAVVGVVVALPRDSVYRLGDGLVGVADRGTSWLRAPVDLTRTAPSMAPATGGDGTATGLPRPATVATKATMPSATVAALQTARAAERAEIAAPRPAEPPRAAEPARAVEPPRIQEPARAVEPPRPIEPPRVVEPPRTLVAARPMDPPRPAEAPRAITPPLAVEPAARAELPPRRNAARGESAMPSKDDAAAASAPKSVEFNGVPRFEMSRERDASGRTAVITVRVTDAGGRPLPSADVRILRQFTDGAVRETQLEATTPAGSYRGSLPNSGPNTDGLVMRILLGDRRFEVPLAE